MYQDIINNKKSQIIPEISFFGLILIVLNLPLINGNFFHSLIFLSSPIKMGEYWRIFTHPFIHVSFYHLLLDAGAFLLIYGSLKEEYRVIRISYVLACGSGSLVLSIWESPVVLANGFCGLSGIAHGMMAVSALECMKRNKGVIWYLVFFVVIAKSIVELVSGHVVFESLHLGMMGVPIGSAHAGGVLGGVIAFLIFHLFLKRIQEHSYKQYELEDLG